MLFGRPESEVHDAKAMLSPDDERFRVDLASDVAAFANGHGGDLLIGVSEKDGSLHGFNPAIGALGPLQERVAGALTDLLRPESFSRHVQYVPLDGPACRCLVVSVPASDVPVAVIEAGKKRMSFPVRNGTTTDYLGWEDLMRASDAASRAVAIRLRNLVVPTTPGTKARRAVLIASRITFLEGSAGPLSLPPGKIAHASIEETDLHEDHFVLKMGELQGVRFESDPSFRPGRPVQVTAPIGKPAAIPYSLVRAVWPSSADGRVIEMMLDGVLSFRVEGATRCWRLVTGYAD